MKKIVESYTDFVSRINESNKYDTLIKEIESFIDTYAGIRPDFDPEYDDEDEKYTSPDASEFMAVVNNLKANVKPSKPFSSWNSGGYNPHDSEEGKKIHDDLKEKIKEVIDNWNK